MSTIQVCNTENIENKILYVLFKHPQKQYFIIENLESKFFNNTVNSKIFGEAKKLFYEGKVIDADIISNRLKNPKISEKLIDILSDFAVSPMVESYCEELFEEYISKLVIYAKTQEDVKNINELKSKYTFNSQQIKHISDEIEFLTQGYEKQNEEAIYTLYGKLDDCIGSFRGGDYIALGGSTGMGKTTIALNLARQACIQDRRVLYFSLEMTLKQLQNRFVCLNEGLSASKYRSAGFNPFEWQKYKQGLENLKEWKLDTVCDFNLTLEKLHTYLQKGKEKGLNFAIIDYLGLINGYENKTLYEKTTLISRRIKQYAGEFDIPILVLVQLNRDLKNRQEKRPQLSDIRESGAIEQDSDFVLFAHREGYYNQEVSQNELEIIIAKNRHGANNKIVKLNFDLSTQLITE